MDIVEVKTPYQYYLNPDLTQIDWGNVLLIFQKINLKYRIADELKAAFKMSMATLFVYHEGNIIAFGRAVGDGRYYVILADIVLDPDYQGEGPGKY